MFCCARTRRRNEGSKYENQPSPVGGEGSVGKHVPPPAVSYNGHADHEKNNGKPEASGLKDGDMVILAGAGAVAAVTATAATVAAVTPADEEEKDDVPDRVRAVADVSVATVDVTQSAGCLCCLGGSGADGDCAGCGGGCGGGD